MTKKRTDPSENGTGHDTDKVPSAVRDLPTLNTAESDDVVSDNDVSFDPSMFKVEAQPANAVLDPFDPSTYKVSSSLAAAAGVKGHLTELEVRTPNAAWWVRCHPHPAYAFMAWVIDLKEDRKQYLVLPPFMPSLMGQPTLKRKAFHLATNMQGKLFLWSVRHPADDTQELDRWMLAPHEAVRLSKDKWVRISWNDSTKQHDVLTCESEAVPEWPELSLRELNKIAFKDFIIDSLNHPVLKRLRGESK